MIEHIAQQYLGDELAELALSTGSILPVKNKRPLVKFKDKKINPNLDYAYDGLALLPGRVGLAVIDYDYQVPDHANVQTKRGGHVWVPLQESDKTRHFKGIDVIAGYNSYAVFYSPHHKVLHTNVQERSILDDLLEQHNIYKTISKDRVFGNLANFSIEVEEYRQKVEDAGLEIDVDWASKTLIGQIRSAEEGTRNNRFFNNYINIGMIGGDLEGAIQAALDCGLPTKEIWSVVERTEKGFRGANILDVALEWQKGLKRLTGASTALVGACVQQHTTKPLINQTEWAQKLGIPQRTLSSQLQRLETIGAIKKQDNGNQNLPGRVHMKMPNNYQLIFNQ